jgi:hypothetical protein
MGESLQIEALTSAHARYNRLSLPASWSLWEPSDEAVWERLVDGELQ